MERARVDRHATANAALSQIAHPVAIIGAAAEGERSCATGTTMYVSHAPPLVAIAEHPGSRTARLIEASGEFSVSLLHTSQQDEATAAGRSASGPDKFASLGIPVAEPPAGLHAPGVRGSIAVLWCRVVATQTAGDHRLVIGEVVAHRADPEKEEALLRFRRRYLRAGTWLSEEAPEGYPT